MTPEQRARALYKEWDGNSIWKEEMILDIERAIAAAVIEEREACAQICDKIADEEGDTPAAYDVPPRNCATVIRNRSPK